LTLNELIRALGDLAEVAVTILLAYVVYKIAILVDTLSYKVKEDRSPQTEGEKNE